MSKMCRACGQRLPLDDDPDRTSITPAERDEIIATALVAELPYPYQLVIRYLELQRRSADTSTGSTP
jgi:hypothetical protein